MKIRIDGIEQEPVEGIDRPWWRKRAALYVGLIVLGPIVPMVIVVAGFIYSFSADVRLPKAVPPFMPTSGIIAHERMYYATPLIGMTGHQQTFAIWDLEATKEPIGSAASNSQIWDKLYWLSHPSDRLKDELAFFEAYVAYTNAQPVVAAMLDDPNVAYAYEDLHRTFGLSALSVWICSPQLKRLVYLSAH